MLHNLKSLKDCTLRATDGDIGKIIDFYFDDKNWIVRYVIVEIGTWLSERKILISSLALDQPDWEGKRFPINLTQQEVRDSPDIDLAKPVSRQQEIELHEYFRWPLYWSMPGGVYHIGMPPTAVAKSMLTEEEEEDKETATPEPGQNRQLRSATEINGYQIQAEGELVGVAEDLIMDDEIWAIRYIVVDLEASVRDKKVLISPVWIEEISWSETQMTVNLSPQTIKDAPFFEPSVPIKREYETGLFDYYDRPYYWL